MKTIKIEQNASVPFNNNVNFCVGTGRMGLALQKEYFRQLKLVQDGIGFKYIRGHGLFSDDMAIYQEYINENGATVSEYNFTYLDMVMDNYKEAGIKPFLELGFMPKKMASGEQTIFYWKGNVTPPKNYKLWTDMVKATLSHLIERYGADEVVSCPVEVWNEPNLAGFWKDGDMQEYFKLFEITFNAVKEVDARFRVGGPAICGVKDEEWLTAFMEFCKSKSIALDFVTRHHYCIGDTERDGHYTYCEILDPDEGLKGLHVSREIVDSFEEYKGLEIHITEFNTSYTPNSPLHDTNFNAAYIAYLLSKLGEDNYSYSYWTFGDIFEEFGVPFTPFHGGFGLVADGGIPKPTFWTFKFFSQLQRKCVYKSRECVITQKDNGDYCGVAWNCNDKTQTKELDISLEFPVSKGEYCFLTKTVDEICCNPLMLWHNMGEPRSLTKEQLTLLKEGSHPLVGMSRHTVSDGMINVPLKLSSNAVVYFELNGIIGGGDRGYVYEKMGLI